MLFTNDELLEFSHDQRSVLRKSWLANYAVNSGRVPSDHPITDLPDLKFAKPVAVCGAAPIARATLDMLAGIKGLMTVCCDKALPTLMPHFTPRFVTALNTMRTEAVELEKWFRDATEDIGLIVPLTVHPSTTKLWRGPIYWMCPDNIDEDIILRMEQETGIARWHRGINVGEFSVSMGAFMRPVELDLFGLWYAWRDREDVLAQCRGTDEYDVVEVVQAGERWWSNLGWMHSRSSLLMFCKELHTQGLEIYNCSEGGLLYHADYCKRRDPADFREKWLDYAEVPDVREHATSAH